MDQVLDYIRFSQSPSSTTTNTKFFRAVQALGRSCYDTRGSVLCIGGPGSTTQKTWDPGRTADPADDSGGLSH